MEARITQFFDRYIKGSYFPEMHITDIIEIIIIAFLVYQLMIWIKNTKAWMLLKGIVVLGVFILLAFVFQMHTILWLATKFTYCSCNCHHSSVSAGAAPRVGKIGREKIYCGSCTF